jgi:hypothetical protein
MTSVTTIRMGFLDTEDRLLVDFVCPDRVFSMLVTRRITRRMIRGLAQILATPNEMMSRVPTTHKIDMLIWEHLSALQPNGNSAAPDDSGEAAAALPDPVRPPMPWPLLTKVDINSHPQMFRLRFEASEQSVNLEMNRGELHRLLAHLRQLARHAEWDLDAEVGWLVEADSPASLRPGSLAS